MRETIFCNHYRAMSDHKTCKAEVPYEKFKGMAFDDRPCFMRSGKCNPGCERMEFPTPEEIAAQDAADAQRFKGVMNARKAIVAHLGGPWKRGTANAAGVIDCPVCGGKESLRFRRAGYNGHIHAACTTQNCVSWVE